MKQLIVFICSFISSICFCQEKFHSVEGNCEVIFPSKPHHLKKIIPIARTGQCLNYDAYLSLDEKDDTVCMMVIANFPDKIQEENQKQSLEGFLNGVINHKNDKKLVFADFSEFYNLCAIDFLLQHQNRYFKGKAFIRENRLYLIAMEYNANLNLDEIFEKYIDSFNFLDRAY